MEESGQLVYIVASMSLTHNDIIYSVHVRMNNTCKSVPCKLTLTGNVSLDTFTCPCS